MFTISKVFIFLFLLCLWEWGRLWKLSKQKSKVFFKLSVQVYYLLSETEWESKVFLGKGQAYIYSLIYLLNMAGNVNHQQSIYHPLSTLLVGIGDTLAPFLNKSVSLFFKWVSRYILFLAKLKGRGKIFLLNGARKGEEERKITS